MGEFDKHSYENFSFKHVNGAGVNIELKEFENCKFLNCNFVGAVFKKCAFNNCTFENCNLSNVSVLGSKFPDTQFKKSKMIGIDWSKAGLSVPLKHLDINFEECIIDFSNFADTNLTSGKIAWCSAKEANFNDANCVKMNFEKTDFEKSIFHNVNLTEATFEGARNYAINPANNKLKKTIFSLPDAVSLIKYLDIILK